MWTRSLVDVDAERVLRLAAESRDYLFDQAGHSSTEAKQSGEVTLRAVGF
jgi:hypothetical protein